MEGDFVKKITRICMIVLIVILIITAIVLVIIAKRNDQSDMSPYIMENNIEPVNDDVIIPQNSYLFFGKYVKGEYSSKEIYEEIYYFSSNTINKYVKELKNESKDSLENFYNSHKSELEDDQLEIENLGQFEAFYNTLNGLESDLVVEEIIFAEEGINETSSYTTAKLTVKYSNKSEISFYTKVYKSKTDRIVFYGFNKGE